MLRNTLNYKNQEAINYVTSSPTMVIKKGIHPHINFMANNGVDFLKDRRDGRGSSP